MITPPEKNYIRKHAYIPEHITDYVNAISEAEPFLLEDYLCYSHNGNLIFIGYPLVESFEKDRMKKFLNTAIERFRPNQVALIAPVLPISQESCVRNGLDHYYKLDIFTFRLHKKLRNTIKRASMELHVEKNREFNDGHKRLISEFLRSHSVDDETRYIFERIPRYISSVSTALLFSARDRDRRLVAFDIAEFGAKGYAFYMFNFLSRQFYVPGASDLLIYEMIKTAKEEGKLYMNLGLGINEGITFFKKKWGGAPFLDYKYCFYQWNGTDR